MERSKDSDHAFLFGTLFALMFVWLSAFAFVLCLSSFVSDGPSVFLGPSVARGLGVCVSLCFSGLCLSVCLSGTSCVSCFLCLLSVPWRLLLSCVGLRCLVQSYLGWSCLVLSACVYLLFLSFSFVRFSSGYSVRSFFALFLHSSKASHVQVFSHANANKAQHLTF